MGATDQMYSTWQASVYLGVSEADVRLMIREGKLRAWTKPRSRTLLVRRADLAAIRDERAGSGEKGG